MVNLLRVARWGDLASERDRDLKEQFEAILDLHYRHVFRLAYRMVRDVNDAADLTQETFLRIYRALPHLRHQEASSAWVRRITVNVCVDFIRRRRRNAVVASLDAQAGETGAVLDAHLPHDATVDPFAVAEQRERQRTVRRAIDELPQTYRTVLLMHHIHEMRVEDVAEELGVPVGTVKSRLSRARRALAKRLAPLLYSG